VQVPRRGGQFYIDVHPVTQEHYQKVMGVNPSKQKNPQAPVAASSGSTPSASATRLRMEGLKPCYDLKTWACDVSADGYRLPTEAEWEYACRAGRTPSSLRRRRLATRPLRLDEGRTPRARSARRQKEPNAWGLYDMLGNVWQWTNDWFDAEQKQRALRGGAWDTDAAKVEVVAAQEGVPGLYRRLLRRRLERLPPREELDAAEGGAPVAVAPAAGRGEEGSPPAPPPAPGQDDPRSQGDDRLRQRPQRRARDLEMHASGSDRSSSRTRRRPHADPKFSPDGKTILYTALKGGFPEVWRMNRDGSDQKKVTTGLQASWSPDGKSIVFIRDNQCFVRDLAAGTEKRVTPEKWERCGVPRGAPTARRSRSPAATSSRSASSSWARRQVGRAAQDPGGVLHAGVVEGREALLCQSVKGHCYQLEADGKNWEQITFGADVQHDARYSPDETAFVYCRAPSPEGPVAALREDLRQRHVRVHALTSEGSNSLPDWHASED
jgi:hypothetical protein